MFRAVLDTCASVPGRQRDFLLQLATEQAYAPVWGTGILFELHYVLAGLDEWRGISIHDSVNRRAHLLAQMSRAFPGATIAAPKDGKYSYGLLDVNDGHVAHAAIIGKVDAIVTDDRRADFQGSTILAQAGIEIVSPREFAANTGAAHPGAGVRALESMSARMSTPPQTTTELLQELKNRYNMNEVSETLRPPIETT